MYFQHTSTNTLHITDKDDIRQQECYVCIKATIMLLGVKQGLSQNRKFNTDVWP